MSQPEAIPNGTKNAVTAWQVGNVLLECYRYLSGRCEQVPRHVHREYQLGFSVDCGCHYHYRGAGHAASPGSFCVIPPDEPHYPYNDHYVDALATYRMMLIPPEEFQRVFAEPGSAFNNAPFFSSPILSHPELITLYQHAHYATQRKRSRLVQDMLLLNLMTHLCRHADQSPVNVRVGNEKRRMRRASDYLRVHYERNVSLQELADIAGLSVYHFTRVFKRETGLSPHVFQVHVRIERAKRLLAGGSSVTETTIATGFYDQSHFGAQFKRLVGITPAQYRAGHGK